jgi:prevent-host-death family protein
MRIASVADVKAKFSAFLRESEEGPVVVTRNGKPVAVLLGVGDEEEIERLVLSCSPRFRGVLARSRKQINEGESLTHDEFWGDKERSRGPKSPQGRQNKNRDPR